MNVKSLKPRKHSETSPSTDRARILHVVESWGGGTQSAIEAYISASPTLNHTVLAMDRPGQNTQSQADIRIITVEGGLKDLLGAYRKIQKNDPHDLVHFHSSFAGVLRIVPRIHGNKAYTPHCYAFGRKELSAVQRIIGFAAEAVLSRRATVLACSPKEYKQARRLGSPAIMFPNYCDFTTGSAIAEDGVNGGAQPQKADTQNEKNRKELTVLGVGRVCGQKDPHLFADIAREVLRKAGREETPQITFKWIGAGEKEGEDALTQAGVHVLGWLGRSQVTTLMKNSDLMLHTARSEGMPIVFYEAAEAGLPIRVIAREYTEGIGIPQLSSDISTAAEQILDLLKVSSHSSGGDDHGKRELINEEFAQSRKAHLVTPFVTQTYMRLAGK